jgi:hypothetical protein
VCDVIADLFVDFIKPLIQLFKTATIDLKVGHRTRGSFLIIIFIIVIIIIIIIIG